MRVHDLLAGIGLGLVFAVAAPLAAAPSSVPTDSNYRLRPDDVIEITVLGLPQLDRTVTILPDGTMAFPRLGIVRAAGLTPGQLKQSLFQRLNRFYNNPDVTVSVKSIRTDRVTITGAVKTPGIYDMRRGWTVRELLATAGGLATSNGQPPSSPKQIRATLIRSAGARIPISLAQLLSEAGAPNVPLLEPDDMLSVEDLTIQVWVDGQVATPKVVSLPPGSTVEDALQMAGGPTKQAALSRASIRRGGQIIPVNLRPLLTRDRSAQPAPVLQNLDTVTVPENDQRFLILGGVHQPGRQVIPEDETLHLTEAIGMAGGPVPAARLKDVILSNVDGKHQPTKINLEQMLKKGQLRDNPVIRPGDIVYVPDPKQHSGFNPLMLLQYAVLLF